MNYLFVHGTLRRGCSNNKVLSESELIGHAETAEDCALYNINRKPVLAKRAVSKVKGEVYSVNEDTLKMVDRLKKHPHINKREKVQVRLQDGNTVEAWAYFHIQPLHDSILIESGEYTE